MYPISLDANRNLPDTPRPPHLAHFKDFAYDAKGVDYSLPEFFSKFNKHFPKIINVTDSYGGPSELEMLGTGEEFYMVTWYGQKRVIAMDSQKRYLSIPLDLNIDLLPVDKKGKAGKGKPQVLKDMVLAHQKKFPAPLRVTFTDNKPLSMRMYSTSSLKDTMMSCDHMDLLGMYDMTYMLGNPITDVNLNLFMFTLPCYVPIRVNMPTGVKGGTLKDYQELLQHYRHKSSHFNFNVSHQNMELNRDIFMFPTKAMEQIEATDHTEHEDGNIYQCLSDIEPSHYVSLDVMRRHSVHPYASYKANWSAIAEQGPPKQSAAPMYDNNKLPDNLPKPMLPTRRDSQPKTDLQKRQRALPPPPLPPPGGSSPQAVMAAIVTKQISQPKPPPPLPKQVQQPAQQEFSDEYLELPPAAPKRDHKIESMSEVPKDISTLTVEQVVDCLGLLHLTKFKEKMLVNQVDGDMLMALDEDILTSEFEMSQFEAKKLVKFAKEGWRPRRATNL